MSVFLLIDGSEKNASVAVLYASTEKVSEPCFTRQGAEDLSRISSEALEKEGIRITDISGLGLNSGPGSYTGLRISGAFAKGICSGLGIPLYALSGLRALHDAFFLKYPHFSGPLITLMDARRDEVFASAFFQEKCILAEGPYLLNESFLDLFSGFTQVALAGSGAAKSVELFSEKSIFLDSELQTHASSLSTQFLAEWKIKKPVNLQLFEPNYLKPFYFPEAPKNNNPLTIR